MAQETVGRSDALEDVLERPQFFRLAAFFGVLGSGAQQATASSATRLQSSGCPSQQSLTRNAITDRMPSRRTDR